MLFIRDILPVIPDLWRISHYSYCDIRPILDLNFLRQLCPQFNDEK